MIGALIMRRLRERAYLGVVEVVRLINGNVRDVKELKGFKKVRIPLQKGRVFRKGCGDGD